MKRAGWALFLVAIAVVSACSAAGARSGAVHSESRATSTTPAPRTSAARTSAPPRTSVPPAKRTPLVPSQLHCPPAYAGDAPWVPAGQDGISGASRLAPTELPVAAILCAYRGRNTDLTPSGWALSGRRRISANVAGMVTDLNLQPRAASGQYACSQAGGIQINYLIALTYAGHRAMWVSVTDDPNQCVTGTNGEFVAGSAWAAADATKALVTGTWPQPPPISCEGPSGARLSEVMVPAGSTSLTICAHRAHVITSNYDDLVAALNGLKSRRRTHYCTNTGRPGTDYRLIFGYPAGPSASVDVDTGCSPPVENNSLQADTTGNVIPIIKRLGAAH